MLEPIEPQADSCEGDHVLSGATRFQMSREVQTEMKDRNISRRDKIKPVYNTEKFREYVAAHPSPGTETPRSHVEEQISKRNVANVPQLSRRRKVEDETEETNIHIRTPQDHSPAQTKRLGVHERIRPTSQALQI